MNHWDGILRWFESQINNGILDGLNSLLQSAKAKHLIEEGYRSTKAVFEQSAKTGAKAEGHV